MHSGTYSFYKEGVRWLRAVMPQLRHAPRRIDTSTYFWLVDCIVGTSGNREQTFSLFIFRMGGNMLSCFNVENRFKHTTSAFLAVIESYVIFMYYVSITKKLTINIQHIRNTARNPDQGISQIVFQFFSVRTYHV